MTDLADAAVSPPARETRLAQLRNYLNQRYGLELARWFDADQRAALVVSRGSTDADVLAAVSVDPHRGVFVLEAYTAVAWGVYGDPFQCTERDSLERAAFWCLQFVPETPCT
jgi:hypothetical protein